MDWGIILIQAFAALFCFSFGFLSIKYAAEMARLGGYPLKYDENGWSMRVARRMSKFGGVLLILLGLSIIELIIYDVINAMA